MVIENLYRMFLPSIRGEANSWKSHLFIPIGYTDATSHAKWSIKQIAIVDARSPDKVIKNPSNWILLGYMLHLENTSSPQRREFSGRSGSKYFMTRDYQRCLSIMLDPMIKFMKKFLAWKWGEEKPPEYFKSILNGLFGVLTTRQKICYVHVPWIEVKLQLKWHVVFSQLFKIHRSHNINVTTSESVKLSYPIPVIKRIFLTRVQSFESGFETVTWCHTTIMTTYIKICHWTNLINEFRIWIHSECIDFC